VFGATIIEKHFTLDRSEGGLDSVFSIEPNEMKSMVKEVERAWRAIGRVNYNIDTKEKKSAIYKRSLYIVKDMKQGDKFTQENMRSIRPGLGLNPKYYETIIGKYAKTDILRGTPLCWELVV
jgi:N-acetylneuraminate synthase